MSFRVLPRDVLSKEFPLACVIVTIQTLEGSLACAGRFRLGVTVPFQRT